LLGDAEQPSCSVEEARVGIAEMLIAEGPAAARTLADVMLHAALIEIQHNVSAEECERRPALQKTVEYLRGVRKALKMRAFREGYR
jgi:hypothetical protein